MDAIPQSGSSQAQGLSALISVLGNTVVKDSKSFGNELAKQIDSVTSAVQSDSAKLPKKDKKERGESNLGEVLSGGSPLVVPPIMPALNLTPADAIAVAPAGVESAAGAVGDESVAPGVPFATQNTVAEANCGAVNDVPANSGLKAGLVAEKCLGGVVDEKRIARSIDQVQTTNPKETQEVDAAKDDYPEPATAGSKKTDTPAAGRVLKTAAEQRDSTQTAEKIFLHTLGEVHEKKKEVSGEEYRQSQSVDAPEAAAAPADQAEQPSPLDAVAQLMPFVPIVTGGGAVSAAAEEIKASGLRGVGPLQKKEAVESLQPKQNDGKSASPVEDPKGTKDHKDAPDEGKRVDPHDFGATLHGAAEQGHQQAEQATIKFNMPDALPGNARGG